MNRFVRCAGSVLAAMLLLTACSLVKKPVDGPATDTITSRPTPTTNPTATPTEETTEEATEEPTPEVTPTDGEATMAAMDDFVSASLRYHATEDDVTATLGDPKASMAHEEGATGATIITMEYANGLVVTLLQATPDEMAHVIGVKITAPDIAGPRGLMVGDSKEKVLASFYRDPDETGSILYCAEKKEITVSETIIVPPRGYIADEPDENGRTEIGYSVPVEPYPDDMDILDFVFQSHGMLTFFIKDGAVDEIAWMVRAMAE